MGTLYYQYGRQCTHKGLKPVLTVEKCIVWAGSRDEAGADYYRMQLAVSLMGWKGFDGWNVPLGGRPGRIKVDWPNGGKLKEGPDFWRRLYNDFAYQQGDALIFCFGGHGRTGTALSVLAWISGACGNTDPVSWVREVYCQEAVETKEQVEYLRELGVETDALPSMQTGGR